MRYTVHTTSHSIHTFRALKTGRRCRRRRCRSLYTRFQIKIINQSAMCTFSDITSHLIVGAVFIPQSNPFTVYMHYSMFLP